MEPTATEEELVHLLLLTCRDRNDVTRLIDVAVGVIEPDFSEYIFYESVDRFCEGYDESGGEPMVPPAPKGPILSLRRGAAPFVGPESKPGENDEGSESA
jgi:hypothetical protein